MAAQYVDLDRRFYECKNEEPVDPEILFDLGLAGGGYGWARLLTKRRVVILAEAGSGKSTEFTERARLLAQAHSYVFSATVEDLGQAGLAGALPGEAKSTLEEWKRGGDDAWFFLDSVDEAKAAGFKFERVMRKLADGISGAGDRCHIFLSGRVADWEPQRDLVTLERLLPVSSVISKPEPTPEAELRRILSSRSKENAETTPNELPFIATLAPLDRERVRRFAEAQCVPEVEQFLTAIDDLNLWRFARRPLDLIWLVRFWEKERRLGALEKMLELGISELLSETNTDRTRTECLTDDEARRAVERIGAAMVFGRRTTVTIPEYHEGSASDTSIDLAKDLADLSPKEACPAADEADLRSGRGRKIAVLQR